MVPSSPRTGTSPTVLPDPAQATLVPGAKAEVPVTYSSGATATLRFEVKQVRVRGALTQADVIVTLVDSPGGSQNLYGLLGTISPALVDRTNLLRYSQLSLVGQGWKGQGDVVGTYLDDGQPHRFRWTFPALLDRPGTIDLLIDSQVPELTDLPVVYDD